MGKGHILKYKSKKLGTPKSLTAIIETYNDVFKIVGEKLLCKICRTFISGDFHAKKHLTCKWHTKCQKIRNDQAAQMENMDKDEFNTFLSESLAAAHIPFEKVENPAFRNFIESISGMGVYSCTSLRDIHLSIENRLNKTDTNETEEMAKKEEDESMSEFPDHEDYIKPMSLWKEKEEFRLAQRLKVKQKINDVLVSAPPKKKRKRDRERQRKREEEAQRKADEEMLNSLNSLENLYDGMI